MISQEKLQPGEVITKNQLPPIEYLRELGSIIAKSRIGPFDNVEQATLAAIGAIMRGEDLFSFTLAAGQNFHSIQGKLTKRSDAMLAAFRGAGGKHFITEDTGDRVAIEFDNGDQRLEFSLTWEAVKESPWPWGKEKGGERQLKDNWSYSLGRRDMMFARVVSRGVKKMMPESNLGIYTPEEFGERTKCIEFDVNVVESPPTKEEGSQPQSQPQPKTEPVATTTATVAESAQKHLASGPQVNRVRMLFTAMEVPADKRLDIVQKRGVDAVEQLEENDCATLIEKLEQMLATKRPDHPLVGNPKGNEAKPDANDFYGESRNANGEPTTNDGPVGGNLIRQIKSAIEQLAEAGVDVIPKLKGMLEAAGKKQIADLSQEKAVSLHTKLITRLGGETMLPSKDDQSGAVNGATTPGEALAVSVGK